MEISPPSTTLRLELRDFVAGREKGFTLALVFFSFLAADPEPDGLTDICSTESHISLPT
jgi:hypothetical protein